MVIMMNNNFFDHGMRGYGLNAGFDASPWFMTPTVLFGLSLIGMLLIVWFIVSIALKGYSLWMAAKRNEKWWFIALLVINTMGILEIIYLLFVAKVSFGRDCKCLCEKCGKNCKCKKDCCDATEDTKKEHTEDAKSSEL